MSQALVPQNVDYDTMLQLAFPARFCALGNGYNDAVPDVETPVAYGGKLGSDGGQFGSTVFIMAGGNANDTVAGSGARRVNIVGYGYKAGQIDTTAPPVRLIEQVVTNGALASVATTATFSNVQYIYTTSSGINAGDMNFAYSATPGAFLLRMQAGRAVTSAAAVPLPPKCMGLVTGVTIRVPSTSPARAAQVFLNCPQVSRDNVHLMTWNDVNPGETIVETFDPALKVNGQDFFLRSSKIYVSARAPTGLVCTVEATVRMIAVRQASFDAVL